MKEIAKKILTDKKVRSKEAATALAMVVVVGLPWYGA